MDAAEARKIKFILEFLMLKFLWSRFYRADFSIYAGRKHSDSTKHTLSDNISASYDVSAADHLVTQHPIRCYVDASFSMNCCTYAGVVLDYQGNFIEAISGPSLAISVLHAELVAIHAILRLLSSLCYTSVALHFDSLSAVQQLSSVTSSWTWSLSMTLLDCSELWLKPATSICHISREDNQLAHNLAQQSDSGKHVYYATYPACL